MRQQMKPDWDPPDPTDPPQILLIGGSVVKEESSPEVYVIYGGAKFHIPNPAEMYALGFTWADVRVVRDGTGVGRNSSPRDGTLLRERSKPEVYAFYSGNKFWIPTPDALFIMGHSWSRVSLVPDGSLTPSPGG